MLRNNEQIIYQVELLSVFQNGLVVSTALSSFKTAFQNYGFILVYPFPDCYGWFIHLNTKNLIIIIWEQFTKTIQNGNLTLKSNS